MAPEGLATGRTWGVREGRIAAIGRINERAERTLDAEGHVVAPGFVDGHTHMDAQVFWDPIGASSCYHGITSVVMGQLRLHLGALQAIGGGLRVSQPGAGRRHLP